MTNRERLIDTLDEIFAEILIADGSETERILSALEAAGYAIYRPDDCATVFVDSCIRDHEGCRVVDEHVPHSPPGSYSLVPVGGEG